MYFCANNCAPLPHGPESRPPANPAGPGRARFYCGSLRTATQMILILEDVTAAMAAEGYSDPDVFAVRLSLEEAIVNALKHGNRGDPGREVWLRWYVGVSFVVVTVRDQGEGFDPRRVPDPLAPENQDRPGGRGLLLMRHYMTRVRFNRRGNGVTLCKRRSGG
jgi:serine/threonine-protein kinase RsbW